MNKNPAKNFAGYVAGHPAEVKRLLGQMRLTIKKAAPQAKETISYGIPTFVLGAYRVHFAAYKRHIGFYPGAAPIQAFKHELSPYKIAKGTVQFPIDQPLPLVLVGRMTKFRLKVLS